MLDWKTKEIIESIDKVKTPFGVWINSETSRAYVVGEFSNSLAILDTVTNQLIKEIFLNLTPPDKKIKRTPIAGYSGLYVEQNKTGFTFQYSFKSPITNKYRFMKLARFKYGDNINKKMLDNILRQLDIKRGLVDQGLDPLDIKQEQKVSRKKTKINEVDADGEDEQL